jgi:hypothetical protein
MRRLCLVTALLLTAIPLWAATLERLSLDEMIQQSTQIVRGRVLGSRTSLRGPVIYTYSTIQVLERWKGPSSSTVEFAVPGGTLGGARQTFSGAPEFKIGAEYVFFLWTGRSGLTQVIGLSQGVFDLTHDSKGQAIVSRAASTETVLDRVTGLQVKDETVTMGLNELRRLIEQNMASAKR